MIGVTVVDFLYTEKSEVDAVGHHSFTIIQRDIFFLSVIRLSVSMHSSSFALECNDQCVCKLLDTVGYHSFSPPVERLSDCDSVVVLGPQGPLKRHMVLMDLRATC